MKPKAKRYTIYLDPDMHKALKLKAIETTQSVSLLVNNAIREALKEDVEDLRAFDERAGEPLISYDDIIKRLKENGLL
jgi:predicted DNA-binding protein